MSLSDIANIFSIWSAYKYLTTSIDLNQLVLIILTFALGAIVTLLGIIFQRGLNKKDLIEKTLEALLSETTANITIINIKKTLVCLLDEAYMTTLRSGAFGFFSSKFNGFLPLLYIIIRDINDKIRMEQLGLRRTVISLGKTMPIDSYIDERKDALLPLLKFMRNEFENLKKAGWKNYDEVFEEINEEEIAKIYER
nr:hypothetical protein [Candidatus Freyarchaeota archaeon]